MKRLLFVRWLALGCAALFLSCKDAVRPDATGSIALQVIVPSEPAAGGPERSPAEPRGHLTSATATATSGTTTKTVTLTGGTGSATFTGTITGLAPGTYTVTVQGFVGTEVDYYGQTAGVSVTANVTTTATITFQSFVPTLSALTTPTASFRPSVSFSSVSNATSYKIEFARDAGFTSPLSSTTTTTSGSIVIADTGTYYARVRAANSAVPQGGRASSTQTFRVVTDQRPSGDVFATATNLGFFSSATVTLDSLNIYPASDDDWFQLSECNGDSLTITAQAVRLSPASPLNSVLQLYSGATARFLAGNDNADSTDARIRVQLDSDGNYRVRVSGSNNTIGHYKLVIQVKAGPNNTGSGCKVQPLAVASISSGIDHTCAVRSDGTVDCWGFNRFGQLGNGTTVTTSSPVRVSSSVTFVSVSAGAWHTCAVPSSGKAWCWGLNNVGQLGNGTTTSSSTPVQFTADFGTFSSVSAGDFHTCGLTGSSIYCWGANNFGQLGNGNTTNSVNGVLVFGGHAWAAVSAGANHTCGLTTGNAIYCWGLGTSGQLGNGGTSSSSVPVLVSGTYVQVTAGGFHTCGRTSGGAVYCWGDGGFGQLGNGGFSDAATPVAVTGTFSHVSAGRYTTCAVASGSAYCWGNNFDGEVGDGTTVSRSAPVAVSTGNLFNTVSTGGFHTCGVGSGGPPSTAYCWGWNGLGQVGDASAFEHTGPVAVSGGGAYKAITTGHEHSCGVRSNPASVYCWGWNNTGQLGDGTFTDRTVPTLTAATGSYNTAGGGYQHACALRGDGVVFCWGNNSSGQLGNGTTTSSATPVQLTGTTAAFTSISAGDDHNCGVASTGPAYCWGNNSDGQLGNGSTVNSSSAVLVSGGLSFKQVSAGGFQSCGVTTANAAYCWGDNGSGGLGNGTTTSSLTPALVSGSLSWASVSAGLDFACGVTTTGVGYCWGENGRGQLGNGTTNQSTTPVQVSGGFTWKTISASRNAGACGITTSDALYCWGLGFTGNLGNGGFDDVSTPAAVLTALKFIAVQAGDLTTCGIAADSTAYCWGNNERGELGNGTRTIRTTPVAVITGPFSVPPLAASAWMPIEPARLLAPDPGDGRGSSQGGLLKRGPRSRR